MAANELATRMTRRPPLALTVLLYGGELATHMNDRDFLIWIHQRLSEVHGENELVDYMHKLRCIIAATPEDRMTPNDGRGGNGYDDLMKRLHGEPVAA